MREGRAGAGPLPWRAGGLWRRPDASGPLSPLGGCGSKLRPMRRTPVFGAPKTDFVFQRVFGAEDHKTALLGFLNDILQLINSDQNRMGDYGRR